MSKIARIMQQATAGAGGAGLDVDEVFSTHLYQGTGSQQTIVNGIDLSTEGGLVWTKRRSSSDDHYWYDTSRGVQKYLSSNREYPEYSSGAQGLNQFNTNGYRFGTDGSLNNNTVDYVSWTFRKAPNFFDVQKWGGNEVSNRQISHNLGTVPGMVLIKKRDSDTNYHDWFVWHRSLSSGKFLTLNTSINETDNDGDFVYAGGLSANPSASSITIGSQVNQNQYDYVAYFFGHNNSDGGFGPDGDQDIIKCDSFTGSGSAGTEINVGFEPQWIMIKQYDGSSTSGWIIIDTRRGMGLKENQRLLANENSSESSYNNYSLPVSPTATGFKIQNSFFWNSGRKFIYMAIRRGPLNPPTSASDVFDVQAYQGNSTSNRYFNTGFDSDLSIIRNRDINSSSYSAMFIDSMRDRQRIHAGVRDAGANEAGAEDWHHKKDNHIYLYGNGNRQNNNSYKYWIGTWKRAPQFFDIITWNVDGTGDQTIKHNLGVVPEMIITKNISTNGNGDGSWWIAHKDLTGWDSANENSRHTFQDFNTSASAQQGYHRDFTSTQIRLLSNGAGGYDTSHRCVGYLFATLAGVSKVGSVSHSFNSTTNVDCGFSSGAKFVLLKSKSSGNWFVWDSVRGIVSGNDPYYHFQDGSVEITNGDLIDPNSAGFALSPNFYTDNYIFYAVA